MQALVADVDRGNCAVLNAGVSDMMMMRVITYAGNNGQLGQCRMGDECDMCALESIQL